MARKVSKARRKSYLVKFRASENFMKCIELYKKGQYNIQYNSDSKLYRAMILKGLQAKSVYEEKLNTLLQDEIDRER